MAPKILYKSLATCLCSETEIILDWIVKIVDMQDNKNVFL